MNLEAIKRFAARIRVIDIDLIGSIKLTVISKYDTPLAECEVKRTGQYFPGDVKALFDVFIHFLGVVFPAHWRKS